MGGEHALHLKSVLLEQYEISEDWEGNKFASIDLKWKYAATHRDRTCWLFIKNYIQDLLLKVGYPLPTKRRLSPHEHHTIKYGAKEQDTHIKTLSLKLDEKGVLHIQAIVGALLFYGKAADNKLLVVLNYIGT